MAAYFSNRQYGQVLDVYGFYLFFNSTKFNYLGTLGAIRVPDGYCSKMNKYTKVKYYF